MKNKPLLPPLSILLILSLFMPQNIAAQSPCRQHDSLELVRLYKAANGANWVDANWNLNAPITTWRGVVLNADGCVEKIQLGNKRLIGTIPNLDLPALTILDLSNNQLTGNIPDFFLQKLEVIDLKNNQLSGSIPNFYLTRLDTLNFDSNKLSGSIPDFYLPNLRSLNLSFNQLTGQIRYFTRLLKLEKIRLNNNRFTGFVPPYSLAVLPRLDALSLQVNQLEGCIPATLKDFCGKSIDLAENPHLTTTDFTAFCATTQTGACFPNYYQADLMLSNLSITTPSVQQGQLLNYTVDVKNIGTIPSNSFTINAYFSTDTTWSTNDVKIGNTTLGSLASREELVQMRGNSTITTSVPVGNYYLILKIANFSGYFLTDTNSENSIIASSTPFVVTAASSTSATVCLNKFFLRVSPSPSSNDFGSLQMYGASITEGFCLEAATYSYRGRSTTLFSKTPPTRTPPVGTRFIEGADRNWLYFTVNGIGKDGLRTFLDTNKYIRIHYWGSETNPDSLIVEFDLNSFYHVTGLKSYRKTPSCTPCFANDTTAPTLKCPSTTVLMNRDFYPTQIYLQDVLQHGKIQAIDNCDLFLGFDTRYDAYWGGIYPIHLVAYDSAGNKSVCDFRMKMPCNNYNSNLTTIADCPRDTSLRVSEGETCRVYTWTPPTVTRNPGSPIQLSSNIPSGYCFPIGSTIVTYTAQDSCENSSTCSFVVTVIAANLPDLTLQNLTIPTPSVQQGQILYFKFDAKNSGTAAATNPFTIKSYLSTDQTLDANDYQNGSIPTGNYNAGLVIPQIQGAMFVADNVAAGNYYLILKIDADNQIAESNEQNNVIVSTGLITLLNAVTTTEQDIALSLTATPSVYRQYSTQNVRISAKNNGNQTFTTIKIYFPFPNKTVGSGTTTPSLGTWSEWCAGGIQCFTWTIPSLAAKTTATLDVPLYVLDAVNPLVATAKLLSSNPVDNTTANNSATIIINPANTPINSPLNQSLINSTLTALNPIFIQKINPTIADNVIVIELESIVNKTIDYQVINAFGAIVLKDKLNVEKGQNKRHINVSQLPKGMYFIAVNGRLNKFIKI